VLRVSFFMTFFPLFNQQHTSLRKKVNCSLPPSTYFWRCANSGGSSRKVPRGLSRRFYKKSQKKGYRFPGFQGGQIHAFSRKTTFSWVPGGKMVKTTTFLGIPMDFLGFEGSEYHFYRF